MTEANDEELRVRREIRDGTDMGRAIRAVREQRRLTQDDVAEMVGITQSYLSRIENGRTVSLFEHELRVLRRLGARVTVTFEEKNEDG